MNELIQFESNEIRRIWDEETKQWYFAVVDVVEVLAESTQPRKYWSAMKRREGEQLSTICRQFKLKARDGKMRSTDCADVEGLFRIIQSIPSPRAEPFKLWLAQIGRERLEEAQDPAQAIARMRRQYKAMGFDDKWIESRLKAMDMRKLLVDGWTEHGVPDEKDHDLLTEVLSKETFGITTADHKAFKEIDPASDLEDHMTHVELVMKTLSEVVTTEIMREENPEGFEENEDVARRGGKIAGNTRKAVEKESGRPVVNRLNQLDQIREDKARGLEDGADE